MAKVYDLIVFGASGVTGKFVVEELARHGGSIKWAVAGRDCSKLRKCLFETSSLIGVDLRVDIIIADVGSISSLNSMCLKTKVVLSCVGPFRFYGENVVRACINSKTHYVDVCGEPQFLEDMQQKYFEEASANDIYIVGACGFDSMPCDIGVEYMRQKFVESGNTAGRLNSVESILDFRTTKESKANFGTWQSAIHSIAHASELKDVRKNLRERVFPHGAEVATYPLKPRSMLFKSDLLKKWCLPFLGSDKSVVYRSQMYRKHFENQKPIQIQTYFCVSSFLYALLFLLMGGIFAILAKFEAGRSLLERYPGFFSCGTFTKDPTRQQLTGGSFTLTLVGTGWSERINEDLTPPNKRMTVQVTGPDMGYVTTAICVVSACKVLLDPNERNKLPRVGGVLTPAAAFAKTNLIEKLQRRGILMMAVHEYIF